MVLIPINCEILRALNDLHGPKKCMIVHGFLRPLYQLYQHGLDPPNQDKRR